MLKKQGLGAEVRKGSGNYVDAEELAQVTSIKDKQIDLLSNMFAQKQLDMKNLKDEVEKQLKANEVQA